jgi:hypothetical protein
MSVVDQTAGSGTAMISVGLKEPEGGGGVTAQLPINS